jgi:hypothetical protein
VKVSIVIDRFTQDLLDVEVCLDKEFSDADIAEKHLENLKDIKIEDFAADGAYYKETLYQKLKEMKITPVIKIPKGASQNGLDPMHSSVREMLNMGGYHPWKDEYQYGHRWNVEGKNSSTKRCFGEVCRMHKKENCLREAKMKFINNERMQKYAKRSLLV